MLENDASLYRAQIESISREQDVVREALDILQQSLAPSKIVDVTRCVSMARAVNLYGAGHAVQYIVAGLEG